MPQESNNQILMRIIRALNSVKWLIIVTLVMRVLGVVLYSLIEDKSMFTAWWWETVTWSTTGYGDQYPTTVLGKLLASWLMFVSKYLTLLIGVWITVRVLIDRNIFSHEEQEWVKRALKQVRRLLLYVLRMLREIRNDQKVSMARQVRIEEKLDRLLTHTAGLPNHHSSSGETRGHTRADSTSS